MAAALALGSLAVLGPLAAGASLLYELLDHVTTERAWRLRYHSFLAQLRQGTRIHVLGEDPAKAESVIRQSLEDERARYPGEPLNVVGLDAEWVPQKSTLVGWLVLLRSSLGSDFNL